MKVIHKRWEQFVPAPLPQVWQFFSRPENLNRTTPADMDFKILTDVTEVEMYAGMMVQYRVTPIAGIPLHWVTEITQVVPMRYFVDEQRFGPYALWHHQHHFAEVAGGVLMTDILHYKVPLGPLGTLANALFVARRIDEIFAYRKNVVEQLF